MTNTLTKRKRLSCSLTNKQKQQNYDFIHSSGETGKASPLYILNAEIFWIDEEQEKYIFKVSYRLISKDGKAMGSYGTGKMDLVEYWTISTNNSDHEPVIINKFSSFADCIHELTENQ